MRTRRSINQLRWPRGTEGGGAYAEVERAKAKESIDVVYLQQDLADLGLSLSTTYLLLGATPVSDICICQVMMPNYIRISLSGKMTR